MQFEPMAPDEMAVFAAAFSLALDKDPRDPRRAFFCGLYAKEMFIQQDAALSCPKKRRAKKPAKGKE